MTAKNITYLLGAGASANCLPIIDELPSRLKLFRDNIDGRVQRQVFQSNLSSKYSSRTSNAIANLLVPEIDWLLEEIENHNTIDTLARKFYAIREEHQNLERLKKVLLAYFAYEQSIRHGDIRKGVKKELPDKRYDSLIATIINSKINEPTVPPNFKIVTWNYDYQFELAYKNYLPRLSFEQIQEVLQVIPTEKFIQGQNIDINRFCLVRLNGIAQSLHSNLYVGKILGEGSEWDKKFTSFLEGICSFYNSLNSDALKLFTYSWEDPSEYVNTIIKKGELFGVAEKIFSETEILVVIGYSFPVFNRSIDKRLFSNCKKLKKIYVQDINSEEIKSLMLSAFPILSKGRNIYDPNSSSFSDMRIVRTELISPIETVTGVRQFFIPPEADI